MLYKINQRALKTVAAAAGCLQVEENAGGFDLHKKHKRLPRKMLLIYSSSWGNHLYFLRHCQRLKPVTIFYRLVANELIFLHPKTKKQWQKKWT